MRGDAKWLSQLPCKEFYDKEGAQDDPFYPYCLALKLIVHGWFITPKHITGTGFLVGISGASKWVK